MTQEQFIKEVAKYVLKYAPQFGIKVHSPIIAQFCLESGYGTSNKVKKILEDGTVDWRHNYAGLKWRNNRCAISNDYFEEGTAEQNSNGTYTGIVSKFYRFKSLEDCVIGYFQFTNISAYSNLKGVIDPEIYLKNIKEDKYATSIDYVQKNMNVIKKWNLTQYDNLTENEKVVNMGYTNSKLANYTKISPNKTSPRNHKIDTITIHCYVGQVSVENAGSWFGNSSAQCSCNYVIGTDGRIGLIVDEKDRSWCSSSADNDHRAITIECASDKTEPYAVNDKVMSSLIKLCADICKRNNIKKLLWKGDKSLIGQVDKQNMTVHRWFKNKSCPGSFLYERHGYIADEVNKLLGITSSSTPTPQNLYRVRKSWTDASSQTGAYASLENAKKNCKVGYSVFDSNGNVVYSNTPVPTTKMYYRVQTGAYKNKSGAIALQNKLKASGFDAIVKENDGLHKVQIGAYSQSKNAEAMLNKVKAKGYSAFISYS